VELIELTPEEYEQIRASRTHSLLLRARGMLSRTWSESSPSTSDTGSSIRSVSPVLWRNASTHAPEATTSGRSRPSSSPQRRTASDVSVSGCRDIWRYMAEMQLKERGPEAAKSHQEEMDFLRSFSAHLRDRLRKLALRKEQLRRPSSRL
jgi:hypothetical protein